MSIPCASSDAEQSALWDSPLILHTRVQLTETPDGRYIVADPDTSHYFACDAQTFSVLKQLQQGSTLRQLKAHSDDVDVPWAQVTRFLETLVQHRLFAGMQPQVQATAGWRRWRQPLAMKFALINPQPLLHALGGVSRVVLSKSSLFLLAGLTVLCLLMIPMQWEALSAHWESRFFTLSNGASAVLAYLLLKLLHELGHGLAMVRFGGSVKEAGIYFMVLMPLPYIDTSASYLFSRSQRVLVGCAGMLVEFSVALLAFLIWTVQPVGWGKDFLFNLLVTGTVSTLVFNLNPLMKFDGYYILSDMLGIHNLNTRARDQLLGKLQHIMLGVSRKVGQTADRYLWLYALLALPYRLMITLFIAWYLLDKFFVVGVLLACWALLSMCLMPGLRNARGVWRTAALQGKRLRLCVSAAGVLLTVYIVLAVVPLQLSSHHRGVGVPAPQNQLRAGIEGFIAEQSAVSGASLQQGDRILILHNADLMTEWTQAHAKLKEFQALLSQVLLQDPLAVAKWKEQIRLQEQRIGELQGAIERLTLAAPVAGVLSWSEEAVPGRFVARGDLLGHVVAPGWVRVKTVVREHEVDKIQTSLRAVQIKFSVVPDAEYPARLISVTPAVTSSLPSKLLGSMAGGDILVDERNADGLTALESVFVVEIEVQTFTPAMLPGTAVVRFQYESMPVLNYLWADIYNKALQKLDWLL